MTILLLDEAERDLIDGAQFYESQEPGVGPRFLETMFEAIESLRALPRRHPIVFGKHRMLTRRFPFGVYYTVESGVIRVHAVLDMRRDPAWSRERLT
jgi:plasmid stabilization system protein ParE